MGGGKKRAPTPQIAAKPADITPTKKIYEATADMVEHEFGLEKDKLVKTIGDNKIKNWPFTQTATDVMTEMALMTGLPVSKNNDTLSTNELFGRLRDFKGLLDEADGSGNIQLNNQQITERLRGTPDYGASFNAGLEGMAKSKAATEGISNPSRALGEAAQFGQGMLDMLLQTHMDRLQQIAGLTVPVALTEYSRALGDQQTIYNAVTEGPKRKFAMLDELADMDYDNRKFNVSQNQAAQTKNQKVQLDRLGAGGGGGGGAPATSVPSPRDKEQRQEMYNPYAPSPQQQAITDSSLYPITPNPYAQQQADTFARTNPGYRTDPGPLSGLFGGLF
jgi:hypothetical protein